MYETPSGASPYPFYAERALCEFSFVKMCTRVGQDNKLVDRERSTPGPLALKRLQKARVATLEPKIVLE